MLAVEPTGEAAVRVATRAGLARYTDLDLQYHESRDVPAGLREAWYSLPLLTRLRVMLEQPLRDAVGEVVDALHRRPPEARR